jgi:hypothetical protein
MHAASHWQRIAWQYLGRLVVRQLVMLLNNYLPVLHKAMTVMQLRQLVDLLIRASSSRTCRGR